MEKSRDLTIFLWLVVIGCNIHAASGTYELLLSCGNSVVSGSNCTMTCDTKTTTETIILWFNGTMSTTIDKNVDCTDSGGLPYESSCNTPGKFDLKITNAQYGRDSYAWSCTSPFGGGVQSNVTDGNTFVSVPLTRVTLTRPTATSISCVAVSSPAANVTLYEGSPPSQDNVVKSETSFAKTLDGLRTNLTSLVNESGTYYCHADNGVDREVVSEASVPESPTTASPTTPSPPVTTTTTTTVTTTTTTTTSTATVTENNTAITTITTTGTTTTPLPIPIYGIVIIVVVVFIILLVAIICCARKCKCQNEKNREGEMCDVPNNTEPQGALYLNLTNQKTGSNNQDEGSCVSSKVNTNQMTVAVDPVEDNPHPGQRSEVGMQRL